MGGMILVVGLLLSPPAFAQNNATEPSFEERMDVFKEVFAALEAGEKKNAANALLDIVNDDEQSVFHAEAYAQMAGILEEMELPYSALTAYQKALQIDADKIPSSVAKAITLAEQLGDTEILEQIFVANVGLNVDDATRSRMAYLAAREAFRRGDLGPALGIANMVSDSDPDFPEAQNLIGIILSQQDRPQSALAPFQIAAAKGKESEKSQKFQDTVLINTARAYFAAENFPQAILHYAQIPRGSVYWLDAQFERAWAHFRIEDMNGVLAMMHTHKSPFFTDEYYPEGELLRIYSLMLMCKFGEANKQIDAFSERFKAQQQTLIELSARDPIELMQQVRSAYETSESDLPDMVTRPFLIEDQFTDALKSIRSAEAELQRLQEMSGAPFALVATEWMTARIESISQKEGLRIQQKTRQMADNLQSMISSAEISKLSILGMEQQMLERASVTGKMEEAKRQVTRKKRLKKNEVVWEYEGEYWADEVGYYRVTTKSECPASMSKGEDE